MDSALCSFSKGHMPIPWRRHISVDYIEFTENMLTKYANNTKSIDKSTLSKYAKFMLYKYLPSLNLNPFRIDFFIESLTNDQDYQEVSRFLV
jgi:hypothetical protein